MIDTIKDKLDDIVERLMERATNPSQDALFERCFLNKDPDEISEFLSQEIIPYKIANKLMEEAQDDGGIIAISGFYFQFLITIEYLIEMLNGKWDYMLVDHHQDIIVFNSETVRIVQVKTKNVEHCSVSDTKLCSSWVPKLLETDKLFEEFPQKREYELVTNFVPLNTSKTKVEHFRHNNKFDMNVADNTFYERIKEHTIDKGSDITEEELKKMVQRFRISVKGSEDYLHKIKAQVGSLFGETFNATDEDIFYLIGNLCSKCHYPKDHSVQLINKEIAQEVKEILVSRILSQARDAIGIKDSIKYIDRYINLISKKFNSTTFKDEFTGILSELEEDMKFQMNNGQNIFSFLSKFINKANSSAAINEAPSNILDNWLAELMDLLLLLKIVFNCKVEIDSANDRLFIKNIEKTKYNLFNLRDTDNYEKGKQFFAEIIKTMSPEKRLGLYSNGILNVIFTGDFKKRGFNNGFLKENIVELNFSENPTLKDIDQVLTGIVQPEETYSTVTYKTMFINGHKETISEIHRERNEFEKLVEYIQFSKEIFVGDK
jgi:hypothetical protein